MEEEPEPEVKIRKIKLRITSDLNPPLSPSDDESNDDPPYQGVPTERPAAPSPGCDVPPPPKVPHKSGNKTVIGTTYNNMNTETCAINMLALFRYHVYLLNKFL